MSQFYVATNSMTPIPPQVATSYVTDSGIAVPSGNVLNVVTPGGGTEGIMTSGSGDTITITVSPNSITGTTTTTGAVTSAVITFPLGSTPGVYTFDISIAGFAKTGIGSPLGCGFTIVGSVITNGGTATLIPTQVVDHFEQTGLAAATAALAVSGNNAIINVTGVSDGSTGFLIDWKAVMQYVFIS